MLLHSEGKYLLYLQVFVDYLQGEQKFLLPVARPKNLSKEMKDFIILPLSEEEI